MFSAPKSSSLDINFVDYVLLKMKKRMKLYSAYKNKESREKVL